MHERPLPILPNFDRDGLHRASARGTPIARLIIQMTRPQAPRAVIAVVGAKAPRFDGVLADDAGKRCFKV